ncbi:MAG TPA: hypothetical protein V6D05_08590 [Stenomitos sp.]
MIRQLRLAPIMVTVGLCFAVVTGGCGQKAATSADNVDTSTSSSYSQSTSTSSLTTNDLFMDTSTSSATASPTPTPEVTPTPEPVATPTPAPVATPTPAPIDLAYALRAKVVSTETHGILMWKTLEAKVQVSNPSFLKQQSGTLVVTFTKGGNTVETKSLSVVLDPAEIRDYSVQSSDNADAATANVITQ